MAPAALTKTGTLIDGAVAELERSIIAERVRAGQKAANAMASTSGHRRARGMFHYSSRTTPSDRKESMARRAVTCPPRTRQADPVIETQLEKVG